ncbi:MAG: hypothetical protein Q8M88_08925 [Phenylobacterium sp.]|uniref:hypothetical protein n=1 Tax=Phenylobacterium sp. TaxID=1871053 RepID=UPI00273264FC|nr:hypothetical protein [Phenylobacterium sp.]MDP3174541.1 hypothetical protein [Phenylobacterium sp.]
MPKARESPSRTHRRDLRRQGGAAKAQTATRSLPMVAIGIVVAFLVVIGALNVYEFGRLD